MAFWLSSYAPNLHTIPYSQLFAFSSEMQEMPNSAWKHLTAESVLAFSALKMSS